jgi:hypothetical protein
VDRPGRPDDGSPARLIAIMVGIVGILLLGSLAWSAVGALFSALGEATSSFSTGRPTPTKLTALVGTPTVAPATAPTFQAATPGRVETPSAAIGATPTPPLAPTPALTATPSANARSPWILLPQPAPGARVTPGPLVIEARGRGDAAITVIRLELDGAALPVSLEQRSESTWRGFASTNVASGHHAVRATVVDDQGRTGGFRWTFDAGP